MSVVEKSPPFWFEFAHKLPYGRDRVLNYLRKLNLIDDRIVNVPFYDGIFKLPLSLAGGDLNDYQKERISTFASVCDKHLGQYDFIDCGAHLGLFSAQFTACSDRVQTLTAIEPNPFLFSLLDRNRQNIKARQVTCINAALADFEGRGRLVEAAYDSSVDAMYLEESPDGDIQVTKLSGILSQQTEPRAAIKIDVEGLEVPVLCGAADAIRSFQKVVLFVEIHKTVLERVGMTDVEMLAHIEGIRPFSWVNADDGAPVDSRTGILEQVKLARQCDLIGIG